MSKVMSDNQDSFVDEIQTDQETARASLAALHERGFKGDVEATALALGRDAASISELLAGDGEIDDDLAMKVNGIAEKRAIDLNDQPAAAEASV